ncbi:MAG: hypothetical protein U1E58_00775 [Tabrizicola sp.]
MLHTTIPLPDAAMLVHVSDREPGILRRVSGRGFRYLTSDGGRIDAEGIARIRKLGIPPAYRKVWICPDPNGHLQFTGMDARGRKQYRYHPAGPRRGRTPSSASSPPSVRPCPPCARQSNATCGSPPVTSPSLAQRLSSSSTAR